MKPIKEIRTGANPHNDWALRDLKYARGYILNAAGRFTDNKNPDKPSKKIIGMLKKLDKFVLAFLVENSANEVLKVIEKDIEKDIRRIK